MYRVKCTKAFAEFPFFHGECINLTISQQQLQLFINYCNFLEEQLYTFALTRVTFGKAAFSKELLFRSTYSLDFLSNYCSFWEQLHYSSFWEQNWCLILFKERSSDLSFT